MKARAIVVATALVFGLPFAAQANPVTTSTFTFTGTCTDCTGFGIGTLVLQNYTLGNPIDTNTNYVSWFYQSDLLTESFSSGQYDHRGFGRSSGSR